MNLIVDVVVHALARGIDALLGNELGPFEDHCVIIQEMRVQVTRANLIEDGDAQLIEEGGQVIPCGLFRMLVVRLGRRDVGLIPGVSVGVAMADDGVLAPAATCSCVHSGITPWVGRGPSYG